MLPSPLDLQCQIEVLVAMVVVTVMATRVVDELEVEAEATAEYFEAGEPEDEGERLQWRFIRQSSSSCLINSD